MSRGNFIRGPRNGRPQYDDPNILGAYKPGKNYKRAKPAAQQPRLDGGKIRYTIALPPYLFDQIRLEAEEQGISMHRLSIQWLEAAASYFEEKK